MGGKVGEMRNRRLEDTECPAAVVVTGGSSGIGKSFIEHVTKVCPTARLCNLSRQVPVINFPTQNFLHVPCDLADEISLAAAAEKVLTWLRTEVPAGEVVVINNAGYGGYGRFPDIEPAHQLGMIDLNVRALVDLTARLMPVLRERGGVVVNVASTAAFQATAYLATYGATKAFVLHWSLALNEELRGTGVRALAVCPGPTATQFFQRAGMQEGSVGAALGQTSDEVVAEAWRAVVRGRALVVTGWKNKVLAAVSSKLPKVMGARIGAKVLERFRMKKSAAPTKL